MNCRIFCIFLLSTMTIARGMAQVNPPILNVAMLGFGGRAQGLLLECLKLKEQTHKEIKVVAICDTNAQASLNFYSKQLYRERNALADEYKKTLENTSFYVDTEQGLEQLFERHRELDLICIASANDRHLVHLNTALAKSSCKNIFIEKPLFKNLSDYTHFNADISQATISVGLTLRYAMMTKIAEQKLREYKAVLGRLQKVRSWESVNFAHAWSIIMMNWRRYRSLSGGLLLEKSVHDLDLALFFMHAAGVTPKILAITTEVSHDFFKKSNKSMILDRLLRDEVVRNKVEFWDTIPWQRVISFSYNESGAIDWSATVDAFFKEFPENDDFTHSDIIPDRHKIMAKIQTAEGETVDFELTVKLNDFSLVTERGTHFHFEHGDVVIDIEQGKMVITMHNGMAHEFDLNVRNQAHAGGDVYVAHTMLGTLPQGKLKAMFNDAAVQLSTVMGLVSEEQAARGSHDVAHVTEVAGKWIVGV